MNQTNNFNTYDDFNDGEELLACEKPILGLLELQKLLSNKLQRKMKRVLVIEDDSTFEPIWDHILTSVDPKIEFFWAETPMQAQELIYKSKNEGWAFDLIVSDIYLSSSITGIDLWNRFGNQDNFLLISSIDNYKLIEQAKSKGKVAPPYIQKPLDEKECAKIVKALINMEK